MNNRWSTLSSSNNKPWKNNDRREKNSSTSSSIATDSVNAYQPDISTSSDIKYSKKIDNTDESTIQRNQPSIIKINEPITLGAEEKHGSNNKNNDSSLSVPTSLTMWNYLDPNGIQRMMSIYA